ncbi:hypothetical protein C2S51_037676 [Perilla frutescens var. frutescens]|nr:hypothetical protein C2S51_037676 [Perilla frutescens var. frutescens]
MQGNQGECQAVNNVISPWIQDVLTGYEDDAYFENVKFSKIYDPVTYPKFILRLFRYKDRVAMGGDKKLREKLLIAMQDTSYKGYSWMNGTYVKLKGVFFQPGIKDVEKQSRSCEVYKLNKQNHVRTQGLLQLLPIIEQPWSQICRDFAEGFSKSAEIDINQVAVKREIQDKRAMLQELKSNLQQTHNHMNIHADKSRIEQTFADRDMAYLKLKLYKQSSVSMRRNLKLVSQYYGPYTILEKIGEVASQFELFEDSQVHPIFHDLY